MVWSDGYFTDLDYTHGYYPDLNPAMLRLACLCRGLEPQFGDEPTCLELGSGQGMSINIHAAGSTGEHWGVDFNPAQTVEARSLAAASGARVRLLDDSFAEFAARNDLPEFDIIALHGVWSWVSEANRSVIVDIIRRRLKPGGIVYVSYNCLPGWAPLAPVRSLMSLYQSYGGQAAGSAAMVEGAVRFVDEIAKAGSVYFRDTPSARQHLEKLRTQGLNYVAHEYLNADWHIEDFSAMAERMAEAKLSFAAPARILDGVDAMQLGDEGRALLSRIAHPVMRETVRDHLMNRQFRADIFSRGARRLSGPEQREAWIAQNFVLSIPPAGIPKKLTGNRGEIELPAARHDPVIAALAEDDFRPKSVDELTRAPGLGAMTVSDLVEVLTVMAGAGFVSPALAPSRRIEAQCAALNDHVLKRARVSTAIRHMASPVTGGGIALPHMVQLFIQSLREGKDGADALAEDVWAFLDGMGERLVKDGKRLESPEQNLAACRAAAARFLRFDRALLETLKVMDRPAAGADETRRVPERAIGRVV